MDKKKNNNKQATAFLNCYYYLIIIDRKNKILLYNQIKEKECMYIFENEWKMRCLYWQSLETNSTFTTVNGDRNCMMN